MNEPLGTDGAVREADADKGCTEPAKEPPTIEGLRRRACTPIALSLSSAFGSGAPRERFDAFTELAERIAKRACEFLNSVYLHSARLAGSIPEVEKQLAELARKNMSFGDYVRSIDFFLKVVGTPNLHPSVAPFWNEFASPLRGQPLPLTVSADIAALDIIKTARDRYDIPVSYLERYVDDHRSGGAKKLSVTAVLNWASVYRNAKAHHHAWFSDEPRWYALIVERWRRVLEQVVLHEPVFRLLATVEVVSTRADMRMAGGGRFLREGGHGASPDEPSRLLFQARGQIIERSSVPDLFREVVRRFGTDSSLQQRVPFGSGRVRYLVARDGRHAAGHPFVAPLEFKEARFVFEANQSRLSALKNLRAWFADAHIQVERAEIDGQSIDDLGAPPAMGEEATAPAPSDDKLNISLRLGDDVETLAGPTVGTFLANVVARLVEEGRLTVEQLPVRIGRVRYLVAQAPNHANGRRFDSPVEAEGMYIESALTRADARFHATTLCMALGIEVLDGSAYVEVAT